MEQIRTATSEVKHARTYGFRSLGRWSRLLYVLAGLAGVLVLVAVASIAWSGASPKVE